MLTAILRGKSRRSREPLAAGKSWRSIFRSSEDFLTSSVFERLNYLDGALLWALLRDATKSALFVPLADIELASMDFWPHWQVGQDTYVEPDVHITFRGGGRRFSIIVEAKLDLAQRAGQLAGEWVAYHKSESAPGENVIILAVGGLEGGVSAMDLKKAVAQIMTDEGLQSDMLEIVSLEWDGLLQAILDIRARSDCRARDLRVFKDIETALGLHGFQRLFWLKDLPNFGALRAFTEASSSALEFWNESGRGSVPHGPDDVDPLVGWTAITRRFRPIDVNSRFAKRLR